VRRIARWLAFVVLLAAGRRRARKERRELVERELPPYTAPARAELAVLALLGATALGATGFVVLYFVDPNTQLLGLALGLAFAALAAAFLVASRTLVPQERREEPLGAHENLREAAEVAELVEEADDGLTRRRLLVLGAGAAGTALAGALVLPAAGLGPFLGTDELFRGPWHRGRRLVDETGSPIAADDVNEGDFVTAFAEGADKRQLAASLVVIRLPADQLQLPNGRAGWAPDGILAFSKICPHAGCAVSMYRYPLYAPGAPGPALVCPCHYSTFDPTRGGKLIFGPAGRALPQLPLAIDADGNLRAAGRFAEALGPSWLGVRMRR
jgi:ubiquinol-cytochrome c reductase iron-sulfur subunit